MSTGSQKISVRLGTSFRTAVESYCLQRATLPGSIEQWGFTDFIVAAIVDKLNHIERSKKSGVKWHTMRSDDNGPRQLIKTFKGDVVSVEAQIVTDEFTDEDVKPVREQSQLEKFENTLDTQAERL